MGRHGVQSVSTNLLGRPLSESEKLFLLRLARTENVGPIAFFHLMKRYGSAEEALERLPSLARRSAPHIPSMELIKREIEDHQEKGILLVSYYEPYYPAALRFLKDPPPFVSMKGCPDILQKTLFSIVGARMASQAGERIAIQITEQLTHQGWGLVSGLARGIDACVHKVSLETGTIAIVAGGLNHIYPPEHKKLFQEIGEKGIIISEDPLNKPPQASLFPKRNRLISGLSWGVLIIEASLKSGSLMTARYAADQGRSVFAVPGHPLDLRSKGANKLIKEGACLVEGPDDILQEYLSCHQYTAANEPEEHFDHFIALPTDYEDLHLRIKASLTTVPTAIKDLAAHLCVSPLVVRIALVEMELNGEIEHYPGDAVFLIPDA